MRPYDFRQKVTLVKFNLSYFLESKGINFSIIFILKCKVFLNFKNNFLVLFSNILILK